MANSYSNYVTSDPHVFLKDYKHASELFVEQHHRFTPKAGWMYYVVFRINPALVSIINTAGFAEWFGTSTKDVGVLAKSVTLPKFNITTETLNQYNRKVVIQKEMVYAPMSITLHDDMDNTVRKMWNYYFQYYYADSVLVSGSEVTGELIPKYENTKYQDVYTFDYGLNNGQTVKFFTSIDVYQLYKGTYSSFKIVNPLIKSWSHDDLDQTQGNRLLTSKLEVEYETVLYDVSSDPGFKDNGHYDNSGDIHTVNGNNVSMSDITGSTRQGRMSPLNAMMSTLKPSNLTTNYNTTDNNGYSVIDSRLYTEETIAVIGQDGTVTRVPSRIAETYNDYTNSGEVVSPAGVNLYTGNNSSVDDVTTARSVNLGISDVF